MDDSYGFGHQGLDLGQTAVRNLRHSLHLDEQFESKGSSDVDQFVDPWKSIQTLVSLLCDPSHTVAIDAVKLLEDLATRENDTAKKNKASFSRSSNGKEIENFEQRLSEAIEAQCPTILAILMAGLQDPKLRAACLVTIVRLAEIPNVYPCVIETIVSGNGLQNRSAFVRQESAEIVPCIFHSSWIVCFGSASENAKLETQLVDNLADSDQAVVEMARRALNHLSQVDSDFEKNTRSLSPDLRELLNDALGVVGNVATQNRASIDGSRASFDGRRASVDHKREPCTSDQGAFHHDPHPTVDARDMEPTVHGSTRDHVTLAFGDCLPSDVVQLLTRNDNATSSGVKQRVWGANQLLETMTCMNDAKLHTLRTAHCDSYLELLGDLLADDNVKMSVVALKVVEISVQKLGPTVEAYTHHILPGLIGKLGDNKNAVRKQCVEEAFSGLVHVIGPCPIFRVITPYLGSDNWRVREGVVLVIIRGLEESPEWEVACVDLDQLVNQLIPSLNDEQPQVTSMVHDAIVTISRVGAGRVNVQRLLQQEGVSEAIIETILKRQFRGARGASQQGLHQENKAQNRQPLTRHEEPIQKLNPQDRRHSKEIRYSEESGYGRPKSRNSSMDGDGSSFRNSQAQSTFPEQERNSRSHEPTNSGTQPTATAQDSSPSTHDKTFLWLPKEEPGSGGFERQASRSSLGSRRGSNPTEVAQRQHQQQQEQRSPPSTVESTASQGSAWRATESSGVASRGNTEEVNYYEPTKHGNRERRRGTGSSKDLLAGNGGSFRHGEYQSSQDRDHGYPDRDHGYPDRDHAYPDRDHTYPDHGHAYQDHNMAPQRRSSRRQSSVGSDHALASEHPTHEFTSRGLVETTQQQQPLRRDSRHNYSMGELRAQVDHGAMDGRREYVGGAERGDSASSSEYMEAPGTASAADIKDRLSMLKKRNRSRSNLGRRALSANSAAKMQSPSQESGNRPNATSGSSMGLTPHTSSEPGYQQLDMPTSIDDYPAEDGDRFAFQQQGAPTPNLAMHNHKALLGQAMPSHSAARQHSAPAERTETPSSYGIDFSQFGPDSNPFETSGKEDAFGKDAGGSGYQPTVRTTPARQRTVSNATLKRREKLREKQAGEGGGNVKSSTVPLSFGSRVDDAMQSPGPSRRRRPSLPPSGSPHSAGAHPANPSSLKAERTYLTTEQCIEMPLKHPEQDMKQAMKKLNSGEWDLQYDGLDLVRKLALNHAHVLESDLHAVVLLVLKSLDNLRSSVSKNSLLTMNDMILGLKRSMDSEIDSVMPALVKKAVDTNVFLSAEASRAVESFCTHCNENRVMSALLNATSMRNAQQRAKVAHFVDMCIGHMGQRLCQFRDVDRLLQAIVKFLGESSVDARQSGKQSIARLLQFDVVGEAKIKNLLTDRQYTSVKGMLQNGGVAQQDFVVVNSRGGGPGGQSRHHSTPSRRPRKSSLGGTSSSRNGVRGAKKKPEASAKLSASAPLPRTNHGNPRSGAGSSRSSSTATQKVSDHPELEVFPETLRKLSASDWRQRYDALKDLAGLIVDFPDLLIQTQQLLTISERLAERLSDGNSKVNVFALQCMMTMLPNLYGALDGTSWSILLPAIANNMISSNKQIQSLSSDLMGDVLENGESTVLLAPMIHVVQFGNSKVQAAVIDKVCASPLLEEVMSRRRNLLTRHVVPMAFALLDSAKGTARASNHGLIKLLHDLLGNDLLVMAEGLPEHNRRKVVSLVAR